MALCDVYFYIIIYKSKEEVKYQESIQSSTTPNQGHTIWESDKKYTRKHHTQKNPERSAIFLEVITRLQDTIYKSKEEFKHQESIQSITTPDKGHHMGK